MNRKPHNITSKNLDKVILHEYHKLQFYKHYSIILSTFQIVLIITINLIIYVLLYSKLHVFLIYNIY
jgi:hypothetical protein